MRGPKVPKDSMATGTKQTEGGREEYFESFFNSAWAATAFGIIIIIIIIWEYKDKTQ